MNILLVVLGIPIGFIWYTYIKEPKKSIKEGLSNWWYESDEDL